MGSGLEGSERREQEKGAQVGKGHNIDKRLIGEERYVTPKTWSRALSLEKNAV